MSGFEYGNARLRAMRSRLLSRQETENLAGSNSLSEYIGNLAKTPYRRSLEIALMKASDLESIFEALRRDFIETAGKIRHFYDGSERELVNLVFHTYDLHNLKTVLRGLSHQFARVDIRNALLPIGEMSETVLTELLGASNPREAIDILATINHPLALPLLSLRAEHPGADLFEMEQALDRWHFQETNRVVKNGAEGAGLLLSALHLEADLANLLMVLRFVHAPAEQPLIRERLKKGGLASLFPGLGSIPLESLNRMFSAKSVKASVDLLMDTTYAPALSEGLRLYEKSGRLSDLERSLRRYQLRWQAWQITKDPLGIGVVLGYLALKANEIANLRWIASGIQLGMGADSIRAELVFVE